MENQSAWISGAQPSPLLLTICLAEQFFLFPGADKQCAQTDVTVWFL